MKKITVLFTVLMMLAASSAWAVDATFPANLNGSTAQFMTGFGINATATPSGDAEHNKTLTVFNSTGLVAYQVRTVATGDTAFYGAIGQNNSTTNTYTVFTQKNVTLANSSQIGINKAYNSIQGLVSVGKLNSTGYAVTAAKGNSFVQANPYYMIGTGSYSLMAGISNSTFGQRVATSTGISFGLVYNSSTFNSDVFSSSNVWDMYAVGMDFDDDTPYYVIGQVKLNSAAGTNNNAQAKYVAYGYDGSTYDKSDAWYNYNATDGNSATKLSIQRPASLTLVENATINSDRDFFSGYAATSSYKHFAVFVKNGVTLSTDDIKNRGFKIAYAGFGSTTKVLRNATGGLIDMQVDSAMELKGNAVQYSGALAGNKALAASINGYSVAVASTNQFKDLTQSNMTITQADATTVNSAFYGKQSASKNIAAGIYKAARAGVEADFGLAIMIPNSAQVGAISGANTSYQNNATIAAYAFRANNTVYSDADLKAIWTDLPSNFVPLTSAIGFNSTASGMGAQRGDVYYTFQVPFSGVGNKISTLELYKIFPTTAKTVRSYTYADAPAKSTDGAWWISQTVGDGYLNKESYLVPTKDYYINYVIKDNGNYDYRDQAREFGDPVILGLSLIHI